MNQTDRIRQNLENIISEQLLSGNLSEKLAVLDDQTKRIEGLIGRKAIPLPLGWEKEFQTDINCHAYALGLWQLEQFRVLIKKPFMKKKTRKNIIGARFMNMLIAKNILMLRDRVEGCIVVYSTSDGEIKHSGILREIDLVESKWGDLPVFRHYVHHVPESYGNIIHYYESNISPENMLLTLYD